MCSAAMFWGSALACSFCALVYTKEGNALITQLCSGVFCRFLFPLRRRVFHILLEVNVTSSLACFVSLFS